VPEFGTGGVLLRTPLPEPDVHVSAHPALRCPWCQAMVPSEFQSPLAIARDGVFHRPLGHLPPFAMGTAFPSSDESLTRAGRGGPQSIGLRQGTGTSGVEARSGLPASRPTSVGAVVDREIRRPLEFPGKTATLTSVTFRKVQQLLTAAHTTSKLFQAPVVDGRTGNSEFSLENMGSEKQVGMALP
jgi:hypothetical protein